MGLIKNIYSGHIQLYCFYYSQLKHFLFSSIVKLHPFQIKACLQIYEWGEFCLFSVLRLCMIYLCFS